MLASGAHIKINDIEYEISESAPDHYIHGYEQLFTGGPGTVNEQGKSDVDSRVLKWNISDWSGGEGYKLFIPEDPSVYSYANGLNGRYKGQLSGRPARTITTLTTDDRRIPQTYVTFGDGALWVAQNKKPLAYTIDGTTYTEKSTAQIALNALDTSYAITALAGDYDGVYFAGYETATPNRTIRFIDGPSAAQATSTEVWAEQNIAHPYIGLAVVGGQLYAFDGARITRFDISSTLPLTVGAHEVQANVNRANKQSLSASGYNSSWFANMVSTENAVVYFSAKDGRSKVSRFQFGGADEPLWFAPQGYTITSICYQNGVIYCVGFWGTVAAASYGFVYALPLSTGVPQPIGWVRRNQATAMHLQGSASSYNNEITFVAGQEGLIFIYDADQDSISTLDDLTSNPTSDSLAFTANDYRITSGGTFGGRRIFFITEPSAGSAGTTIQAVSYKDDDPSNSEAAWNGTLIVGDYDFGYPDEIKNLMGVVVKYKPMVANQSATISYSVDGGANFTALTAITSASTGNSIGRTYIDLASSNVKFAQLQIKIAIAATSTAKPPTVFDVVPQAVILRKRQSWRVAVKVSDEKSDSRPSNRMWQASKIRDALLAEAVTNNAVTFLDGYRYGSRQEVGSYTTHTVTVEEPTDVIDRGGEGYCYVTLREVPA